MTDIDRRDQVAKVYAGMTETELKDLADEAWSLTETGIEALRLELGRRGLNFDLAKAPSNQEGAQPHHLIVLRQFRDLPEALLAKGFLQSAGVESFLIDETTIRMDWLWSNALGGIKLGVKQEDADAAAQLLNQEIPGEFRIDGVGDYKQPTCPQCESLDISYEDLDKPVAYVSILLLGLPVSVTRIRWKCNSCGHIWQPAGNEENQTG